MEVNQLFVKAPRSCCYKMLRLLLLTLFFLQIHGNPISMDFKASKPSLIQWLIIESLTNWYFQNKLRIYLEFTTLVTELILLRGLKEMPMPLRNGHTRQFWVHFTIYQSENKCPFTHKPIGQWDNFLYNLKN